MTIKYLESLIKVQTWIIFAYMDYFLFTSLALNTFFYEYFQLNIENENVNFRNALNLLASSTFNGNTVCFTGCCLI